MSDDELSAEARNLIAAVRAERTLSKTERDRSYARIGVGIGVAASGVFAARSASGASSSAGAATAGHALVIGAKWWVIGGLLVTAGAAGIGAYAGSRRGVTEHDTNLSPSTFDRVEDRANPREVPTLEVTLPAPSSSAHSPPSSKEGEVPLRGSRGASRRTEPEERPSKIRGPNASAPSSAISQGSARSGNAPSVATATTADDVLLLHQARAALRSNPAKAVTLARNHEQRYPRSQLGAEREVVMILGLCSLGRTSEAQRRAAALASRSPALSALEGSCAERR